MTLIQRNIIPGELNDIINGYVIGDGYVNERGILTVDNGVDQRGFVEWMHEKLKPICTPNNKIALVVRKADPEKNRKETRSYRFNTRSVLRNYHKAWYRPGQVGEAKFVKELPKNFSDMFTPRFISVWYASDGTKTIGSKGAKLEVTALPMKDRETLQKLFESKYNITPSIIKSGF